MRNTFIYELKRLLSNNLIAAFMIMYMIGFLYYINTGLKEYKNQQQEENSFIIKESLEVKQYTNYEQYGGRGIKVIKQSSPLDILMNRNCLRNNDKARLNSSEEIDIDESKRLRDHFSYDARIKGAADLIMIFATLFAVLLGYSNFRGKGEIILNGKTYLILVSIMSRIILTLLYFAITFLTYNYILTKNNINLNANENILYSQYLIYTALLICLCYLTGLCISLYLKKEIAFLIVLIFWICMAVVLPEIYDNYSVSNAQKIRSNIDLNLDKMSELMKIEKKAVSILEGMKDKTKEEQLKIIKPIVKEWRDNGFIVNEKKENEVLDSVREITIKTEQISLLYPSLFYYHLTKEISSNGNRRYIAFDEKIRQIRSEFLNYYLTKRYGPWGKGVESFIKSDENILTINVDLNDILVKAMIVIIIIIVIFVALIFLQIRRILIPEHCLSTEKKIEFEKGNIYFKLFKTVKERDQEFESFKKDKKIVCLNLPAIEEYSIETSLLSYIKYWCFVRNINTDKAIENLNILGINTNTQKSKRKGEEFFNKIYAAIILAMDADTYVINEYLNTASREFDRQFRMLLNLYQERDKKTFIYLSTEVCTAELRKNLLHNRSNGYMKIDVNGVILR